MAQFDLALPKFSEGDLDDAKQRRKIMNYLYKLDEQLRFVLNNLDTENFTETFQQVIVSGGGKGTVDDGSIQRLETEMAKLSTMIRQTASQIELKADAEELNELGNAVASVETSLTVLSGKIESKVSRTEFDELGNAVSKNSSTITQTASSIRSEVSNSVSGLQSQIDQTPEQIRLEVSNIRVGGRNYLRDSGVEVSNAAYNIANYTIGDIKPQAGKEFTLRIWGSLGTDRTGFVAHNTNAYVYLGALKDNGDGTYSQTFKWNNAHDTYPVTTPTQVQIYQRPSSGTSKSTITRIKLEKGNKATDWTAAPEDTDAEFEDVRSEIALTKDQITLAVNEVQVGGRNLLRNTGDLKIGNYSFDASGWSSRGTYVEEDDGFRITCANQNVRWWLGYFNVTPGETYAMSMRYKIHSGTSPVQVQYVVYAGSTATNYLSSADALTTKRVEDGWTIHSDVLTIPNNSSITRVRIAMRTGKDSTGYTVDYSIKRPKLEIGSKATDWTPHPEEFQAGTNVKITKDEFRVTTPEFNVDIPTEDGTDTMMHIDKEGVYANRLESPTVAPRYAGPKTLYVNPNATQAQIKAGTHFLSLSDVAENMLNNRWVTGQVIVELTGEVDIGEVTFRGIHGGTNITLQGTSSSHAKLTGRLNLYYNSIRFVVKYLDIDTTSNGIAVAGRMQGAEIDHCIIRQTASSSTDKYGIAVHNGGYGKVEACELYDFQRSLRAYEGGVIAGYSNKGNCTVGVSEGTMHLRGTQPCASTTWTTAAAAGEVYTYNVTVNQGSKPTAPTVTTTTVTYSMTNADNYTMGNGSWTNYSDEDIRQGYTSPLGEHRGCFWFDNTSIRSALNGKTIKKVTLSLYQMSAGRSQPVQVSLEGITMNYSGRTGVPYGTQEYGVIGTTLGVNQTTTFTVPKKVITDLVAGTTNGLMLRTGETSVMKNDDNSYHFARFAGGTTTAYKPVLTVTYQT